MKKTWFNRLLISYVPILFITITIIIFISVSIMSQISFKETEKANHVFSKYVTDSMDTSLHDIERLILENMVNNDEIKAFLSRTLIRIKDCKTTRFHGKLVKS